MACIGIYGLTSYAVTRRTNEIGIRMALGAEASGVLWMVMRESLTLVAHGRGDRNSRGARGRSPGFERAVWPQGNRSRTIALAALVMIAVAALAGYLPARRAAKVDPMVALRYE